MKLTLNQQDKIKIIDGSEIEFDSLGLVNSLLPNTLSFLDDSKYCHELIVNENICAVIITEEVWNSVKEARPDIKPLMSLDPRYSFYFLQNILAEEYFKRNQFNSIIDKSAIVHETSHISKNNVVIESGVVIEPNVTILSDVYIGRNTIIRAGAVIGSEGFEHKRTKYGILSVKHDGKVIIGQSVDIGANCTVSKGFAFRDTIIGNETKLDNLVHVAHGVQIGDRCFLPACCMIAGSTTLGNDVWIGPGASISSQIHVGDNSYVTIGSVVTKDVSENAKVTGNFAVDHATFLNIFKNNLKNV